jgi:hypothetical protein
MQVAASAAGPSASAWPSARAPPPSGCTDEEEHASGSKIRARAEELRGTSAHLVALRPRYHEMVGEPITGHRVGEN